MTYPSVIRCMHMCCDSVICAMTTYIYMYACILQYDMTEQIQEIQCDLQAPPNASLPNIDV